MVTRRITWRVGIWCRPKTDGGLVLGRLVSKNISLVGIWLWRFPLDIDALWHCVIRSKYGLHRNGWDTWISSSSTHVCRSKFISQISFCFYFYFSLFFLSPLVKYKVGNGLRGREWLFCCSFSTGVPNFNHARGPCDSFLLTFRKIMELTPTSTPL